ncbi:MAG: hypothetical protein QNJ54_13085 [Prochloraceae cyanobacterium]|nr:hypothetical protein [Prochloraceae cyanobacterium]
MKNIKGKKDLKGSQLRDSSSFLNQSQVEVKPFSCDDEGNFKYSWAYEIKQNANASYFSVLENEYFK